jgi:hypothetical protein
MSSWIERHGIQDLRRNNHGGVLALAVTPFEAIGHNLDEREVKIQYLHFDNT